MHDKLIEATALEARAQALRQEVTTEARNAPRVPSDHTAYDWTITETNMGFRMHGCVKEYIKQANKAHMELYGMSQINPADNTRSSVEYMRNKHGILCHGGGGWLILNENQPVTDAEWADMLGGNIPEKFWHQPK